MSSYPETFLRGLQDNSVSDSGYVISEAFKFNTNIERTADDRLELSVNWEDNNEAVDILLSQTKEGKDGKEHLQFKRGFSRLHLREVKQILKALVDKNDFGYERRPLESNPYHGNLLQNPNLKPAEVRLLTNSLAAIANNSVYLRDSGDNPYLDMKIELMERKEEIKNPQISVIVPVYNVEKYLHKCVDSILKQTLSDIEVILVDDGSPDGSGAICDEYAQKDSRVKVIHKPNGGVSSARNAGIEVARGEWLCFVDSDDYIDETYLEDFGVGKGDADMYMQGYKRLYNGQVVATTGFDGFNSDKFDDVLAYSETNHIINSPCFKLYKNELVTSNKLRFDTNTSYGEDHLFSLSYVLGTKAIKYSKGVGYNYLTLDSESLTNRKIPTKQVTYYIKEVERLSDNLIKKNKSKVLKRAFDETFVDNIVRALRYCFYAKPDYNEYRVMLNSFNFANHNTNGIGYKRDFVVNILRYFPHRISYLSFLMLKTLRLF